MKKIYLLILISFQLIGQDITWINNTSLIRSYSSPRTTDINNDGVDDVIIGGGVDGLPTPYGVIAINGLNGNTIWTMTTRNEMFTSPQFCDYTGDNIDDILIGGRDAELRLINGATGELIWEFWDSEDNTFNDAGWYNFYTPQIIDDQTGDGVPDILAANGGDHSLDFSVIDRPPGHIMIIDGLLGTVFKTAVVPDSNETYMSPVISDLNGDGNKSIIYGTGGESIAGNLWIANFTDLMQEDLSNSIALIPNSDLGHIAPPSIGDLNSDGILDIITQGFDGKVSAINGSNLSLIWQYEIENTESSAAPILGCFSNTDNSIDVFATIYSGSMSSYSDYYQVLLDGENGTQLWIDSIGLINFCTPVAFDSNNDNTDEVLISIINNNGEYFTNELVLIDFINNTQESIIGPIAGGNIASTPQITDIENDGLLDIILSVQADSLDPFGDGVFYENGINTLKIETNYNLNETQVSWGSYMGTNFDGHFNDGCNGDLGLFAFPSEACPGESNAIINLYVSAGSPPYTYQWSNGETTEDIDNLSPGLYTAIVTDSDGICSKISREVTEYGITSFSQSPTCIGDNDGLAYFNSTGCDCNTSFCQFIWMNENGDTIAQGDGSTATETYKYLFNIVSGTYSATIIHPDGCEVQQDIIVPEPELIDDVSIQGVCENNSSGWIDLIVNSSDSLIQNYLWNTGDTTQDIFNLSAGSYSVIVSDTICSDTLYYEVGNTETEEILIISEIDIGGPTFINAPEVYSIEMENTNMGCQATLTLWIGTTNTDFSWEENENIIVNSFDSQEFSGWSQINLTFINEGVYEFNTYMNTCPDYGDSIEITVTDSCNPSGIHDNINPNIFIDSNKYLIIDFQNEYDYEIILNDIIGKEVFKIIANNTAEIISLNRFKNGIYSLQIRKNDITYNKKILIN